MDKIPLIVDLDKTLIKNDLFQELFVKCFFKNPLQTIYLLYKHGVLHMKHKLLTSENFKEINILPNEQVVSLLKSEYEDGRDIYIVTASNQEYADKIKSLFQFIKKAYGSKKTNLKGFNKLKFIKKHIGEKFDYYGDSRSDQIIFNESVNYKKINTFKFRELASLLRLKHWVKNLLIFIPLVLTASKFNLENFSNLIVAFLAFSLTASFGYVYNDLTDFESDRNHVTKKKRPIASGAIGLNHAILILFILIATIFILAITLEQGILLLLIYFVVNISYSFKLKKIKWLDIIILSSFYLIRLLFGASVVNIEISYWLLFTSFYAFFYLSLDKRLNELILSDKLNSRRAYKNEDIISLNILRISSILFSTFIYNFFLYQELQDSTIGYKNYILISSFLISLYAQLVLLDDKNEDLVKKVTTNKKVLFSGLLLSIIYFLIKL